MAARVFQICTERPSDFADIISVTCYATLSRVVNALFIVFTSLLERCYACFRVAQVFWCLPPDVCFPPRTWQWLARIYTVLDTRGRAIHSSKQMLSLQDEPNTVIILHQLGNCLYKNASLELFCLSIECRTPCERRWFNFKRYAQQGETPYGPYRHILPAAEASVTPMILSTFISSAIVERKITSAHLQTSVRYNTLRNGSRQLLF